MEKKCAFLDVNVEGKVACVQAMNAYGTMEVQLHSFSTSTLSKRDQLRPQGTSCVPGIGGSLGSRESKSVLEKMEVL
jgi:hypothetical protein